MTETTGATRPIWLDGVDGGLAAPPLEHDETTDVCIVGAGIAGLSVAYSLSAEGYDVIVLDAEGVGSGETGRTTAHLSNALDDRYCELARLHGEDGAFLAATSHTQAIARIAEIVEVERLDCGFERLDGYLHAADERAVDLLERELKAARRASLHDVELVSTPMLRGFPSNAVLHFPRQGQFHPLRYLAGLAQAIRRRNGRIFGRSAVAELEDAPPRVTTRSGHSVAARAIVVATNSPINDRVTIHTKQAAYRTYALAFRTPTPSAKTLCWDTADPYHYVRSAQQAGEELLIVGGEDHKTGQPPEDQEAPFAHLVEWTREHCGPVGELAYRWSGQVLEPNDRLAFIGRNPGDANTFIATGDSGHGMTHGTIAGMLLADLIAERPSPWAALYDPGRVTVSAAAEFVKENVNVAAQYAGLLKPGEVRTADAIAPGTGAIMREGLEQIAVYRDEHGALHRHSALCTHLGCVVGWNDVEKTWDCPCHGSRFHPLGSVLNGPAIDGLRAK